MRFDPDGKNVVIADRLDGKKLSTPNDLAIDRKGRIWFTNPVNEGNWDKTEVEELDHRSVLRADPQKDGKYTVTRVTFDTTQPNGILVSQDQKTLYVAESGSARGIPRQLRAYPIREDGSLGAYDALFTWGEDARGVHRGIDGMCLDAEGNIVATAGYYSERIGADALRVLADRTRARNAPGAGEPPHQLLFRRSRSHDDLRDQHERALLQGADRSRGLGDVSLSVRHAGVKVPDAA